MSKISRLLLFSPGLLLVFLLIPAAVLLNMILSLKVPLLDFRLMMLNNICFALFVLCRLVAYLSRLGKEIRYFETVRPREEGLSLPGSVASARGKLAGSGFRFNADGVYGEKRDAGYLGSVIFYLGLLLFLGCGCWDNLHQFYGVVLDGVGPATKLSKLDSYRTVSRGVLMRKLDALPDLRVLSQIVPDSTYPKGATEVALISENAEPITTVLRPGAPLHYGPYDVYMQKLVYMPEMVVRGPHGETLYDGLVQLDPLVKKRGDYSFYGLFVGPIVGGGVYYNPEKKEMKMVVSRNGSRVVADMTFQQDQQVKAGEYTLSCARMGQWSEIHVEHRRHKQFLILAGIIALLGLALRLAIRPQRVWLEHEEGGFSMVAVGNEPKKLLQTQ